MNLILTIKLLGSTKIRITRDNNSENVLHLKITGVALVHCNMANNDYQHNSKVLLHIYSKKIISKLLDK